MLQNIQSKHLLLLPFSPELMRLALHDRTRFKQALGVDVTDDWPDADFAEFLPILLATFEENPTHEVWDGLIILKEQHILVGAMGLKGGPDAEGTAEIGYGIVPQFQGRGYATEMATALITWSFKEGGMKKIVAECLDTNIGSVRVLQKLGMRQYAIDGDMLKWTLSKEEWSTTQK